MQFTPYPPIETKRLKMRKLTDDDAHDVFLMRSDPEVMRYIPRPLALTEEDALALIRMVNDFSDNNEKINWGIEWKATGQIIGTIGFVNIKPSHFRAEIGYALARDWHRKGIMSEALLATMKHGFEEFHFHSIEAIVDAENIASASLLISTGFRQEAFFKEDFYYNNNFRNSIHFGMLKSEALQYGICK